MKITKQAALELSNDDLLALRTIATIVVLEMDADRTRTPAKSAYERPGLMLDFTQTRRTYDLAKALKEGL